MVLSNLIQDDDGGGGGSVLTPQQVSQQERIFEWDGVLRWWTRPSSSTTSSSCPVIGKAHIGVPLQHLLSAMMAPRAADPTTGAIRGDDRHLQLVLALFENEAFLFWFDARTRVAQIVLKQDATPREQLKAWAAALWVARRVYADAMGAATATTTTMKQTNDAVAMAIEISLRELTHHWPDWVHRLETAGWDIDVASLEVIAGTRVIVALDE